MDIYIGQINPTIGDLEGNTAKIVAGIKAAKKQEAAIAVFPELALTGYPPEDLLLMPHFLDAVDRALKEIATGAYGITVILGTARKNRFKIGKPLHNTAAVIHDGSILGYHDKLLLPTYDIFNERRYFEPGVRIWIWEIEGIRVAITICEDIWLHSDLLVYDRYTCDPIKELLAAPQRPSVLINISASPYSVAKSSLRAIAAQRIARALRCPVILCNQVGGNDSLIFDGGSLAVGADGAIIKRIEGFVEESFTIDIHAPVKGMQIPEQDVLHELFEALVLGLRDYFKKSRLQQACLGISGGIDSAVVACIAVAALGKENVIGVSMPSRYSSEGSVTDAVALAAALDIKILSIPIENPFSSYLALLSPHCNEEYKDITEENLQPRIRGTILMALSNQHGYTVLNTGNKSELAMGYTTLYGDMCGALAVIGDLTKRRVYALAHWINKKSVVIPQNTLTKPPSAELKVGQIDSDTLPDYECIDIVIEEYLEYRRSPEEIALQHILDIELVENIIKRIHKMEYKRRQAPPVLRVTEKAFSAGLRLPIAQGWV